MCFFFAQRKSERSHKHLISSLHRIGRPGPRPLTTMAFPGAPELIFGCGGLGNGFVGEEAVKELLKTLKEAGVSRLDTVVLYPPTDIGASQRLLGQVEQHN
ncbi:hypothetical protein J3459_014794 [Metarhizium acridum]|uniref:uncharacterized protein n=1 Tax=Metarhizium acridum TaxID=92637 RepID=UPI001C6CEDB4|nr:hypothetical protein J3458_014390 [Metarhizium acridum]KAG8414409.1 hypothetical protein J3459_014794 [Metarhizium acridum]